MKSHTVLLALLAWYAAQGLRNCRASVCLSVCLSDPSFGRCSRFAAVGPVMHEEKCWELLIPVIQCLQTSCLSPCKTNDRICPVSLLTKLSPRGGGGGETIYSSPMAVRLAADLRPSADRSAVLTSLVAASCRQPACR